MSVDNPSIIELAYELCSSYGALSVEEMAFAASQIGYEVPGWEFQSEIESHMSSYGEDSPFICIGYDQYGLWEQEAWSNELASNSLESLELEFTRPAFEPAIPPPPYHVDTAVNMGFNPAALFPSPPEFIFPIAVGVAVALALALALLSGGSKLAITRAANAIFLPSTAVAGDTFEEVIPASESAEPLQSSISIDPNWWFANTTNQMNEATQAIARQYLSNYYNTCGPAVVAMLASFLFSQREEGGGPVTTAGVMQDARNQLGFYTPPYNSGLLTFDHLRSMLELYGMHQVYPEGESSLLSIDSLLERVREGKPAIAGVRYSYQGDWSYRPSGGSGLYNHFVVIFAIEQVDGQEYIWISNTHPGKYLTSDGDAAPVRMSTDEFWNSWALKNGSENSDYGHAAFYE